MNNIITELKKIPIQGVLPPKPTEESTRKWIDGMESVWQKFLQMHREGKFPNISNEDIRKHNENF